MNELDQYPSIYPQVEPGVYDMMAYWRKMGGEVLSVGFYVPPVMHTDPIPNRLTFDVWLKLLNKQKPLRYGNALSSEIINEPITLLFKLGMMDFRFECKGEASDWSQLTANNPYKDVDVSEIVRWRNRKGLGKWKK